MHASREPTPPRYIRRCQTRYSEPGLYLYGNIGSNGGDLYGRSIYTRTHVEPALRYLCVPRDSSNRVDIYVYVRIYVGSLCGSGKGRRRGETYISGVPVGFTGNVPPLGHVQGTGGVVWPRRRYIHRRIARDGPRCVCVVSLLHIAKENADTDPLGEPQSERVLVSLRGGQ